MNLENLEKMVAGLPNFRKTQAYDAIFKSGYDSWEKATNFSYLLRKAFEEKMPLSIDHELFHSKDGKTTRALMKLSDGKHIETVLIRSGKRNSVCVSTQLGCPMGCAFCASGKDGFTRNLTVSEMVEQILLFSRILKKEDEKVSNIVFMGMGEPFLNYKNVIETIRFLNNKSTLGLATRRFSISTSGVLSGIKKLSMEENMEVNLAISLHSAIDKKRDTIMPVNKKFPLSKLAEALSDYYEKTSRKIMIEYVLIKDFNISDEDAVALRKFINELDAAYVVNIIPLNETSCGYEAPTSFEIGKFKSYLEKYKINFVQRFSSGGDINAACGQLVRREKG